MKCDNCNCKGGFEEYYKFYLGKHQNRWCRRFHFAGQVATFLFLAAVLASAVTETWMALLFLPLTPFIVYPFAVFGHLFEGEWPAFFSSNPLRAKRADLRMCWDMLRGRLPF